MPPEAVKDKTATARRRGLGAVGILAAQLLLAVPVLAVADACSVGDSKEARPLADRLYAQGDYQGAGDCYQAAGDSAAANEAFLKAVQPNAKANAQALRAQADTAKALFTQVAHAFHGDH